MRPRNTQGYTRRNFLLIAMWIFGEQPVQRRVVVAVGIGLAAGFLGWRARASGAGNYSDFDLLWIAARFARAGRDPYQALPAMGSLPLYYPLPAVLVVLPFAAAPMVVAYALFAGIGAGLMAYAVTAVGWWPLVTMLGYAATQSITLGQWSLASTAIAVLPGLAWLAIVKPTTAGAVAVAYLPRSIRGRALIVNLAIGAILMTASFVILPNWVSEWRAGLHTAHHYTMPITYPLGVPLVLALLRWRRPEARLIFFLALAPQSLIPYDTAPLALVVRTKFEAIAFVLLGALEQYLFDSGVSRDAAVAFHANAPTVLLLMYLPALVMVLRRPNVAP